MLIVNSSMAARRTVAVGTALLALAIAGCGSSSNSTSTGQSGLTKSALVSRVNAICKRHNDAITAAASKMLAGGNLPTPAKFGKLAFGTIIPQTTAQVAELSALKPQATLASSYKQWLADSQAMLAKMKQNPISIQHKAIFVTVNHEAVALGLSSDCHRGPS